MVREKFFRQPSDLNVVSPQAGKVFDKDGGGFSLFQLADHFYKTRAIHRHAGNAVIQKMNQICVTLFLCDFGKQFLLRWNLSRGFSAKHNVSENSVQNICRAVSPQRMRIIGSMVFFYL